MNISMADKETMASLLDQLGESTGGYYFYYDFAEHLLHVSRNVVRADHLFSMSQPVCTLSQWRKKINPHDLDRVIQVNDGLVSRNIRNFSINYRVVDSQGQSFWVNSCCGSYFGEQGTLSYVLGRLTVNLPPQDGNPESSLALKSEVRKLLAALQPGYLLLVGVDNLKSINIRDGRNFGDAVLEDVARVMEDETDHKQQVYRVNGDFFALNLPDFTVEQVRGFFGRVQERLAGQCTISGGAVPYTRYHVADENILLQYAETALECSKRQGKNLLTFFTPESYEKKLRELELREDLQSSIETGFRGFEAYLQPQFRTENLSLYGAEVLLRYGSPRLGSVSMNEVIPVLEQSGLICPVGLWVLREALRLCRRWRETFPEFHISVNMSYRQLEQASIAEDVLDLVNSSGVPGSALTIEITESMELVDYPQLNQLFCRWRRYGIQISVDDFGTGYSSLGRLNDMEIDEIKIDRCFVTNVQNSAYNYRLLNSILDLADTSSVRTCCEGVDTVEELHVLRELRCSLVQGYLFAKP